MERTVKGLVGVWGEWERVRTAELGRGDLERERERGEKQWNGVRLLTSPGALFG